MKKPGKMILKLVGIVLGCVVLFFVFILCRAFFGFNDDSSTEDLSEYQAYLDCVLASRDSMPALDECGAYQKAELSKREHIQYIFDYSSVCLFLQYTEEEYDKQAEQIEKDYLFFREPTGGLHEVTASIGGYEIRVVDPGDPSVSPYKGCLLIGFNEDLHAIMYACYYDEERDYIDDLDKALKEYLYIPRDWKS